MSNSKVFGYARVSSKDQNLDRQLDALKPYVTDPDRDIYTDKKSGKDFNRDGYKALLAALRGGDTLYIVSLDRLGRDYTDIQAQWAYITQTIGADIVVLDMPLLDTRNSGDIDKRFISDLTLQILSYVAQKERESIKARQAAGIEAAKKRGVEMGRPNVKRPDGWDAVIYKVRNSEITSVQAMKELGLKKTTYYKLLKEYDIECNLR